MLDSFQQLAVDCDSPRILLRAGAGSGKTRTLTARIQRLVGGEVHPAEILALTFTRKAAAEMRERLSGKARRVHVSTFHSWAASVLREWHDLVPIARDFSIRDERDKDDLLKLVAVEQSKTGKKGLERDLWPSKPLHPATRKRLLADADVMRRYRQPLREAEALDYDLLETELLRILPEIREQLASRYLHVLVDEYQDTSETQQAILDLLSPGHLFVVGDHAQSIYAFRGARVEGFVEAANRADWTVLDLPRNYRSVPAIVETANRCAAHMAVPGVEMEAERGDGGGVLISRQDDRDAVWRDCVEWMRIRHGEYPWSSQAILSPTWDLLERLSEVLTAYEIPHEVARKRLDVWESDEMRWLLDCARVAVNPWDHLALRSALLAFSPRVSPGEWAEMRARALELGCTVGQFLGQTAPGAAIGHLRASGWDGIGAAAEVLDAELRRLHLAHRSMLPSCAALDAWLASGTNTITYSGGKDQFDRPVGSFTAVDRPTLQDLLTWYSARRITDPEVCDDTDRVTLTTIHGAKGLEWPAVWVIGLEEGRLPRPGADIEEARRLSYVACTRARDRLVLCVAGDHEPSRFLAEIQQEMRP